MAQVYGKTLEKVGIPYRLFLRRQQKIVVLERYLVWGGSSEQCFSQPI